MRFALVVVAVIVFASGCGTQVTPPTASPLPAPTLRPLSANVAGIPGPADATAMVESHSRLGELELNVAKNFALGHCGLMSPIDIDGALWDPIAGHDGQGGPLTEGQLGELINATPTVVELTDPNSLELRTPLGAVITLERHQGARAYFLCD
ncbi:MAG: hypothetical protein ACR2H0_03720 [Candidatus Limnocylindrales bacterium]